MTSLFIVKYITKISVMIEVSMSFNHKTISKTLTVKEYIVIHLMYRLDISQEKCIRKLV